MAAALATAVSTTLLFVDSMTWSEPLFIALILGARLCLSDAVDAFGSQRARGAPAALSLAGVLTGVASITRYAGIAFVANATIMILIQKRHTVRDRVVRAMLFASLSMMPLVCWVLYNRSRSTTGTNRELAFTPCRRGSGRRS
jgi:4-amino-4-deoxy-L-arabinose transferase-like glycosyltransferase